MKFKDKISFLSYLTLNENYGPLKIQFSEQDYGSVELSIYPLNFSKSIPENIYDTLYDIIWYNFYDTTELLGYSNNNISNSEFTIQNNNGELEIIGAEFSSSHDFEKDVMIEQLTELLQELLLQEFMLSIHMSGLYNSIEDIKIKSYYLSYYDQNEIECEVVDNDGSIKSIVVQSISSWAKSFSYESSNGEYEFDEFDLNISISSYANMDTWCNFYEESNCSHIDLSVLEINTREIEIKL
ncbi:MAG: hypothetical protein RIT38_207 [Bacteroidota bacterium]|jgi:hypothetical protein